ncbi:MAG: AAA family ATPase [Pseudomonadota bacterium]
MQTVLAVTNREDYLEWLNQALSGHAEVVVADEDTVERVLQLVDAVSADGIFVQLGGGEQVSHLDLIEGLLAVKPHLAIAVFSESTELDMVVAAMRAGARDLVTVGSSERQAQDVLYRLRGRAVSTSEAATSLAGDQKHSEGEIYAFLSARPYEGVTTAAVHTALALNEQAPEESTLLLDLGVPAADSLLILDLQSTYTFVDAVRSVRRLDHTLIRTAFTKHRSGLTLLSLPEEPVDTSEFTPADVMILFNILKGYFKYIVVNLGGVAPSEFVQLVLSRSDRTLLVAEQAVPIAHASKRLLNYLNAHDHAVNDIRLLVDRYTPDVGLESEDMAEVLNLDVEMNLPSSGLIRLRALNTGRTIFEEGPDDRYAKAIRELAGNLSDTSPGQRPGARSLKGLWARLRQRLGASG